MIQTITLFPGITLRCFPDNRFKQGCLSIQLVRPMSKDESALNALIPAVLLRGCQGAPDLRSITLRLDDLYGASVGALVRRVGDYQTTGLYCGFISDRHAMDGDAILSPTIDFLGQLLLQPVLENGAFVKDFVESEKKNLVATIESQYNDKRAYATAEMIKIMCRDDSFGIPRLGEAEQVKKITPGDAYDHYRKILKESRIEIFYVGEADPQTVAEKLTAIFASVERSYVNLPSQTSFAGAPTGEHVRKMEVAQGKLAMGFTTPMDIRTDGFVVMQVLNMILGGGMTSKLFMNVRERMSLCYDISSAYHGSKGILTVNAGVDFDKLETVRDEVVAQLKACCEGDISEEELTAAKQSLITGLRGIHDTPGAIENYYATSNLSGLGLTPAEYISRTKQVTREQVAQIASTLTLNTVYFLKGVR